MKRIAAVIILLAVFALAGQFLITLLINRHKEEYSLLTDKGEYLIKEEFAKQNGKHNYSFVITDKQKNKYIFSYQENFNKRGRIIDHIETYKSADKKLTCIYPIYKKKKAGSIICNDNKHLVSATYLKQTGNNDIDNFMNELKSLGYKNTGWDVNNAINKAFNIDFYGDFPKEYILTVWGYKGIYKVTNEKQEFKDYLEEDQYENSLSVLVDKYYVTPIISKANDIMAFMSQNLKDGGKTRIEYIGEGSISGNCFINGVRDGKIYLTDLDNKKQYTISPSGEDIKEVGDVNKGAKYYDGSNWQTIDMTTMLKEKKVFIDNVIDKQVQKLYPNTEIKKSNNNHYIKTREGILYKIVKDNYKDKIALFKLPEFKEWMVVNDTVFGISKDTIYMYNAEYGLKPLVTYSELLYNDKNMYDVYEVK